MTSYDIYEGEDYVGTAYDVEVIKDLDDVIRALEAIDVDDADEFRHGGDFRQTEQGVEVGFYETFEDVAPCGTLYTLKKVEDC